MATTLFDKWVIQPENLASVKDAINETAYADQGIENFVTIKKVKDNDPIALIGDMAMVGKKGAGCGPTFDEVGIANSIDRWKLGDWQAPIKICYDSMKGTIAEFDLHDGSERPDISGTAIEDVYMEKLNKALLEMTWRLGWFGDTNAKNVKDSGKISDSITSLDHFNICDGLFKRIFTATADNHTAIAANKQTSTALQKSKLLEKGVATDLFDNIIMNADTRIVDDSDAVLMVTRSMADALAYDAKKTYQINLPWEKIFSGFDVTTWNGIKIARVGIWDRMIAGYEKGTATLNLPHRAVFCNPKQLMIGTDTGGILTNISNWYNPDEREYRIDMMGKIGTALLEKDLISAAY